jgi:2-succinyl-5-enolpyruvyl-6-hydroxy-3-cyclohexene-1-carboxylate synthase
MKMNLQSIYFCTGARNHDLLKYLNESDIHFEFDERVASFKALGLSKITGKPVGICTTSGTAVSETISAMLEAYYSEVPLVLITGDRPKKLHGTGSPQTIEHELLTRSCRKTFIEINLDELENLSLADCEFPVHINVLVDDTTSHSIETHLHQSIDSFNSFIEKYSKPLFIFSHENKSMRPLIEKFSRLNLPFYAESLSGARDLSNIKTEKKLIELFLGGAFSSVVRVGHTPLSKIWRLLEKKPLPVFSFDSRNLSGLSFGERLPWDSTTVLKSEEFWSTVAGLEKRVVESDDLNLLDSLILKYPQSDISLFSLIQNKLQPDDIIYLGNSLVIRFFELTQKQNLQVFGNRGVNGIDGQLASAIGIASGTKNKVFCILGDVTTFYDLSSMRDIPENLHLIIMNNKGGRIFDMLNLDKRIVLEHEDDFKNISQGMGLSYSHEFSRFGKVQVLELFPLKLETEAFLKEWNK